MVSPISFWKALNPPIYLVSVLPLLSVLTLTVGRQGGWVVLAGIGVVWLQHGINVLNDVTDWRRGADVEKTDSWIRYHRGNLKQGSRHGWASVVIGLALGLSAVFGAGREQLLLLALPLVALGISYNSGKKPLSYSAWGEWATGLCYGPGVAGCLYWLAEGRMTGVGLALVAAYACLSVGILLSHQPPQVLTDSLAGKQSFAVRHGARNAANTAKGLFSGALIFLCLAHGPQLWILLWGALVLGHVLYHRANPKTLLMGATQVVAVAALVVLYSEVIR